MLSELERQIAAKLSGEGSQVINAQIEPTAKECSAPAPGALYRKANPKSSPGELEYAREYARKRRAALKAQKVAALEPPAETTSEEG